MKTAPAAALRAPPFHRNSPRNRSSALLIVLGCLVLISVLIVAFFYAVTAERQSAQLYANTSSVKMLADSTVSIVQGQIKNATKGTDTSGNTLAWASQPGMIRNYNTQGQAVGFYKLYSWNNMVTTSFNPTSATELPPTTYAGWSGSPAIYTDLNEPVSGVYPIVDPAAKTNLGVKGFDFNTSGMTNATSDAIPMPVKWLYVLQSGQVIAPDTTSTGNTAAFTQAAIQPTATNAIVARIAFWTDDDTCKVNVNTAAGDVWVDASATNTPPTFGNPGNPGSFWDTPRVWDNFETNLALNQPAQGEYQRYPGHPAQTYLSAVFPTLLTTPASIYAIVPRISLGGSLSGTTFPSQSMLPTDDDDRLYSSVDELLVNATNMLAGTPPTRVANSPLTKTNLEQAKFFLTAASRAPEVNLYNEPRVVIWPVSTGTVTGVNRTAYDNLLAYCGTLNKNLYYFQRSVTGTKTGANSPTQDLPASAASTPATDVTRNRQLINYLRNVTSLPVPGFSTSGETFLSKYPKDRDQILTEIFDYIRSLNTQDQGVTSPYTLATYGSGEGQIVPITDTDRTDSADSNPNSATRGFGHMPVVTEASLLFVGRAETGTVTPTQTSNTPLDPTYPAAGSVQPGNTRIQAALLLKFFDPCQGYAYTIPNFKVSVTGLSGMTWGVGAVPSTFTSVGFNSSPGMVSVTAAPLLSLGEGEQGITPFVYGSNYASNYIATGVLDVPTGTPLVTPGVFSISDTKFTVSIYDSTGTILLQTYNLEFPAGTFPVPRLGPMVTDQSVPVTVDYRLLSSRFSSANATSGALQTFICGNDTVRSIALTTDPRSIAPLVTVPLTYTSGPNSGLNLFTKVTGWDPITVAGPPATTTYTYQAHGIIDVVNGNHRPLYGALVGKFVPNMVYSYGAVATGPDFTPYLPAVYTPGLQQAVTSSAATPCGVWKATAAMDPTAFTLSGNYAIPANGVFLPGSATYPGDWDNGSGFEKDGAYINKADEGAIEYNTGASFNIGLQMPYFGAGYKTSITGGAGSIQINVGANFSPNRQMPSAGMFGSLPTGAFSNNPYQTLLFRPSPDGKVLPSESPVHIGAQSPQDHLMLDLFNMPIVEPYAISDPFSTAGKVNMNYQIVPFTYITRSTAVQAVLRSEQLLAVPGNNNSNAGYKGSGAFNYRYFIDLNQTLTGFTNMFTTGTTDGTGSTPDIFRSASQICNIWLVPAGLSPALSYSVSPTAQSFWLNTTTKGGILTGDNSRERPYANLYPRLTTKSNTFTVHMRVQTLKALKSTDPTFSTWVEGSDIITGEYRGSTTMERYLDTSDTTIPDYATLSQPLSAGQAIDNYYKFRVIETKQFTP